MLGFPVCDIVNTHNHLIDQVLQAQYTFDRHVLNKVHHSVIRTRLRKETLGLVRDVYEEVIESCNQYIPVGDGMFFSGYLQFTEGDNFRTEWTDVFLFENIKTIVARAANRIFVGPILCESNIFVAYWHCQLILSVDR